MDNFGHDVAQKIKSAIKAKLVELDSYVDDELPDYIMVMVANKKAKAQMTEDLSLFLSDNTIKFVEWLHGVLERLQAVTLDGQRKSEPKSTISFETSKQNLGEVVSTSGKGASEFHNKVQHNVPAKSPSATVPSAIAAIHGNGDLETQDEMLTIKAETYADDMLADELREDMSSTSAVNAEKNINPISPKKILYALSTSLSVPLRLRAFGDHSITQQNALESEKQSTNNANISVFTAAAPPALSQSPSTHMPSRKRKALSSTVGAVVQREFPQEAEEDDEYDPRHPVIGTVASVVKVSRRNPSVPVERQASKMLLLKAVDEAQKSILQSVQKSQVHGKPSSHDPVPELFTKAFLERQKQWRQHQQEWRIKPSLETKKASQSVPMKSLPVHEDKQLEIPEGLVKVDEIMMQESKDEAEDMIVEAEAIPSPESDFIVVEEEEMGGLEDEGFAEDKPEEPAQAPKHNRHVVIHNRNAEKPPSPKFIITLDGVDNNAFMSRINDAQWLESNDSFAENNGLEISTENNDFSQEEMESEPPYAVDTDTTPSEDAEMHQYDDDFEIENDEESSIAFKKQKPNQSCRYWPSCKNGAKCNFVHPRIHCKSFPNCKFGSQCLYIHPYCKYGDTCTRRNCPFTHNSRRTLKAMPAPFQAPHLVPHPVKQHTAPLAPQKIVCRNIPTCSNVDCQYYHPKPCRYGQGCTRADCVFFHPPLPTPDKLKWNKVAGSQENSNSPALPSLHKTMSDRKLAVSQVRQKLAVPVSTLKI